ncbi:MAG: primosomal protein N' [Coriobacteriaceae bacterium]|nr:primosomal protein N' [Coriobacteriaceae bacterium]
MDQPRLFSPVSAAGFALVVVDVSTRSVREPYAYAVGEDLLEEVVPGAYVLVRFGGRPVLGVVASTARALADLPGAEDLDPARLLSIDRVLAPARCAPYAASLAEWMSREYVCSLAECMRLFLPPGGLPRLVRDAAGAYALEDPQVSAKLERVVSLTSAGADFVPAANAPRQRQLVEALSCGPLSTRELGLLYPGAAQTVRALQKKGVVEIRERRAWRGVSGKTSLSSADGAAPARLTDEQRRALEAIDREVSLAQGGVVLVDGVTGSGKTEVYLSAIEHVVGAGRSACVLVPEISLTAQTVGRFRSRFGDMVAIFHSRLSAGERLDQWDMVASGTARVVVGARSALFCPFFDLGLIVVDEEHEQSYKQGSQPRYHAREVAARLARMLGIPLVLGSATPSAEALFRTRAGSFGGQRWTSVRMSERPGGSTLPKVEVVDLCREFSSGSRSVLSRELEDALKATIERGEKAILLHNRRGFAPFLMCRECGCVPTCKHCSTSLTYHERTHTLQCHTCGATYRVNPYPAPGSSCPRCGSRYLAKMGCGTQQVEDVLASLLGPGVPIIRMDADTTRGKDAHTKLLERFDAADAAVLVGTQMIAKGLDFPEVTLVGVVNADYALKMPDFRARERSFDLLEQVAGRAGRGDRPGRVIIQTYLPKDPVLRAVSSHDRSIFTDADMEQRLEAGYPPFVRLSNVVVRSRDRGRAEEYAKRFAAALCAVVDSEFSRLPPAPTGLGEPSSLMGNPLDRPVILGPTPCVIERAKDCFRLHLMVKSPVGYHISEALASAYEQAGAPKYVNVSIDVDAYDLM